MFSVSHVGWKSFGVAPAGRFHRGLAWFGGAPTPHPPQRSPGAARETESDEERAARYRQPTRPRPRRRPPPRLPAPRGGALRPAAATKAGAALPAGVTVSVHTGMTVQPVRVCMPLSSAHTVMVDNNHPMVGGYVF